jgi:hypothetical protein
MEATRSNKRTRVVSALALSIAALLPLVNARAQSLTSVNTSKRTANSSKKLKDLPRLIEVLLTKGVNSAIGSNLAPAIGLEKSFSTKTQEIVLSQNENELDARSCFVVLADSSGVDTPTPMCLFIRRTKRASGEQHSKYFKVSLLGKLEKAVVTSGKIDEKTGRGIAGSGAQAEQDIESSDIKKEFDAEMAYWLKDWLKKEQKADAKKKVSSTSPAKTGTAAL